MIRNVFAVKLVLTLALFLTSCPGAAVAASPENAQQGAGSSGNADPKSEAAEAWDAVKDTKNPALLEAFIKRYGSTFFAELAKARLDELKAAAAAKAPPRDAAKAAPTLQMPAGGTRESAVLYDEDPSDPKGQQYTGSVVWRTETIKAAGKPDELAAHADIDIPSRSLRMSLSLRRNLDPSLPASHTIELTFAIPGEFRGGGIANVPGILMNPIWRRGVRRWPDLPSRSPTGFSSLGSQLLRPTVSATSACCSVADGSISRWSMPTSGPRSLPSGRVNRAIRFSKQSPRHGASIRIPPNPRPLSRSNQRIRCRRNGSAP